MLHQYSDQPFSDLGNHYSAQLNSCSSYLLNPPYSEASKVNDSSTSSNEENDFLGNDLEYTDEYSASSFDVESVVTMGKDVELQSSTCCESFEEVEMKEKLDDASYQQLIKDEQNNNVRDLIDDECRKDKSSEQNEAIPPQETANPSVEVNVQPPAHKIDEEVKVATSGTIIDNTTANRSGNDLSYDETESNSRLPGFQQAFGSTEIGRFVHQKDFIEQINQQTAFMPSKPSLASPLPPCSSSPAIMMHAGSSPKIRARYNKRLKVPAHSLPPPPPPAPPPPIDIGRNIPASWSAPYECDVDPSTVNFQSTNHVGGSNFYTNKYRDPRSRRSQYFDGASGTGPASSYCNGGGDDYYNCPPAYYYGGGGGSTACSESVNCDYYNTHRYQQNNSSYYHNGYSTYPNHTGYTNGYHHGDRYSAMMGGEGTMCGMNQNCQPVEKYYSSYNGEQISSYHHHYNDKLQSGNSPAYHHQYQPYVSHNQHQLPSQQTYNNYTGYNAYGASISNFNYY